MIIKGNLNSHENSNEIMTMLNSVNLKYIYDSQVVIPLEKSTDIQITNYWLN